VKRISGNRSPHRIQEWETQRTGRKGQPRESMDGWRQGLFNHRLIQEDKVWRKFSVKESHCMVKKFFGV
jgi:hypothetical protein